GQALYFFNAHFHHVPESVESRTKSAELIRDKVLALPEETLVIVVGDFNTTDQSEAYRVFTEGDRPALRDAWRMADHRLGPEGTFHAFTGTGRDRIDWILVRGPVHVTEIETIDVGENGLFPSDHFPVRATLQFD